MVFKIKKISKKKTVGERLKQSRTRQKITIEQAEEATKIRRSYLIAFEKNYFQQLPADVYAVGYLNKYCQFLGLKSEKIVADFTLERQIIANLRKNNQIVPKREILEPRLVITPKIILAIIGGIVLLGFLGYILYGVRKFSQPPSLIISQPAEEANIKENSVKIIGRTDQDAIILINQQAVMVDEQGNFSQEVKLTKGLNEVEVKATNRIKKDNIKTLKILANY